MALFRSEIEQLLALLKERGITPILVGPSIYDETMRLEGRNYLGANSGIQACRFICHPGHLAGMIAREQSAFAEAGDHSGLASGRFCYRREILKAHA